VQELIEEQLRLRSRVRLEDAHSSYRICAGVDVSYRGDTAVAACVLWDMGAAREVATVYHRTTVDFPYIPGFLSYRELPAMRGCIRKVRDRVDVFLIDGNGILHPRGMGIASHLGVVEDVPTIGVAKNLLMGEYRMPRAWGVAEPIRAGDSMVGYAYLSSRRSRKPIFISPGHMVSMETALEIVRRVCVHRIPEPIRLAHMRSGDAARSL